MASGLHLFCLNKSIIVCRDHIKLVFIPVFSAAIETHFSLLHRLLVQLEETEKNFDEFWSHHHRKLQQCLQLRQFEEGFRHSQAQLDTHLSCLQSMQELGDSVPRVDTLIMELRTLEEDSRVR